jgi:hypothetical protein
VVEKDDLARQHHDGAPFLGRQLVGQGRFEDAAHVVGHVAAHASGHGRERAQVFGARDREFGEAGAQARHVILPAEVFQGVQARVVALHVELAACTGEDEPKVPADEAVPAQTAVHFGALQEEALLLAHQREIERDGRLRIRRQPGALLGKGDHGASIIGC